MFLQYYALREQPFGVTPNPRYLYHSPAHREALASLIYGIEADLGFAALIAEPGMGKTTLLFYLLEKFRNTARTALVFQTQCNAVELLRYVANELDIDIETEKNDPVVLFDRIRDLLVNDARAGRRVIVIIDEAQNLGEEALEAIRLLSDFETPEFKLLHIILAGQPPLAEKLARPSLAQLLQRIAMLNRLVPFAEVEDVSKYIAYRLKVAGYTGPPLFAPEALDLIVKHSHGVPRQINRLCFNALSIGCATKKRRIDGEIIREVLSDLDVASLLGIQGSDSDSGSGSGLGQNEKLESQRGSFEVPANATPLHHRGAKYPAADAPAQRMVAPAMVPAASVVPAAAVATLVDGALALSPALVPAPAEGVRPAQSRQPEARSAVAAASPANGGGGRAAGNARVKAAGEHSVKAASRPIGVQRAKPPLPAAGQSRSLALIVLCVIAVPLLVLAAWFYLEREHILPGATPSPGIEQNVPSSNDQPADSTTVPQASEPENPPKPKKNEAGKRSELLVVPRGRGFLVRVPAHTLWLTWVQS